MLLNFKPNVIPVMDMTSMEVSLLYYLIKEDVCQHHLVKLSFSSFYLTMFGEMYKSGNSRTMQVDFNNAISHFEKLGLLSTVLDNYNCKIVDITNLYETDVISFNLKNTFTPIVRDECYKIFKDLDIAKHIRLKVFRTYIHLLTTCIHAGVCLPDEDTHKDLGLSYNTYAKYIKYLKDLGLIKFTYV